MLLDRLKIYSNATATHATHATCEGLNAVRVAQVARVQVASPIKTDFIVNDAIISNWWLIHFVDREPVQVAMWPPCNQASAFASYPNAIAAEPIHSPIDEAAGGDVHE